MWLTSPLLNLELKIDSNKLIATFEYKSKQYREHQLKANNRLSTQNILKNCASYFR